MYVVSLAGWWREREKRSAADEALRLERERLESELGDREEALERVRGRRSRSEEAHQTERNWRQELHAQISRTAAASRRASCTCASSDGSGSPMSSHLNRSDLPIGWPRFSPAGPPS